MSASQPLRIALVATPRSGNSWLGHMLTQMFEIDGRVMPTPYERDWNELPERVFLNTHWGPDEAFLSLLKQHGFRTIVLAHHPLDVLISILVFSQHYHATDKWLAGATATSGACRALAP